MQLLNYIQKNKMTRNIANFSVVLMLHVREHLDLNDARIKTYSISNFVACKSYVNGASHGSRRFLVT